MWRLHIHRYNGVSAPSFHSGYFVVVEKAQVLITSTAAPFCSSVPLNCDSKSAYTVLELKKLNGIQPSLINYLHLYFSYYVKIGSIKKKTYVEARKYGNV